MKSLRKNKSFSLLLVILAALFLTIANTSLAADSVKVVKGTIVSVDPNSGNISVLDDAGKTVVLKASPDNDLKDLQKGDKVKIEYDDNNVIQSIDAQM